jgi:hypothetical protein
LIVLLVSVPFKVRVLLPVEPVLPDCIVIWNPPVVTPLSVPLRVKPPVSVVPEPKHEFVVLNFRLVTLTPLLPVEFNVVVKPNAGVPLGSVNVAVQLPLIALPFEPPHPTRRSASSRNKIERIDLT